MVKKVVKKAKKVKVKKVKKKELKLTEEEIEVLKKSEWGKIVGKVVK